MITIYTNNNNLPILSTLNSSVHLLAMIPQVLNQNYNLDAKNQCIKLNINLELQIFFNLSNQNPKIACNSLCAIQCHIFQAKTNPTEIAILDLKCKVRSNIKNNLSCKKPRNSKNSKSLLIKKNEEENLNSEK